MAGDTEVLKSFLVSLGFKIDDPGYKKFTSGLTQVTKGAIGVGASVIGVATAVEIMVDKFASGMAKLYYSSQRTKASVANIEGLEVATQSLGLSAGTAQQALESMASVMLQPGKRGMLDQLIGHPTEALEQTGVLIDALKKLHDLPVWLGAMKAKDLLGMDETTFRTFELNLDKVERQLKNYNEMLKIAGINEKEASEKSVEYEENLSKLGATWDVLKKKMFIDAMPTLDQLHGGANVLFKNMLKDGYWKGAKEFFFTPTGKNPDGTFKEGELKSITSPTSSANLPLGLRQHNPGNLRSWGDTPTQEGFANFKNDEAGLSAMAANLLKKSSHGLNTIRQIIGDEKWGWSPASGTGNNKESTENYIKNVAKSLGISADEIPYLKDANTLSKMMGAMISIEQGGKNPFSSAQLLSAANSRLGEEKQINIKTDIHVNGTGDPKSVADNVLNGMSRVYGNATRNTVARVE